MARTGIQTLLSSKRLQQSSCCEITDKIYNKKYQERKDNL